MDSIQYSISLVGRKSRNYLSPAERQRFIEAAHRSSRPEIQTFVLTLVYTGCQISEALSIRACDVDIEQQYIYFFTRRKNREFWREIPIPHDFARALELVHSLRKHQADFRLSESQLWNFSRTSAFRYVNDLMKEAKIEGLQASSRGIRNGFGVAAIQAGVPLPTIAAVLGHSTSKAMSLFTADFVGLPDLRQVERMW